MKKELIIVATRVLIMLNMLIAGFNIMEYIKFNKLDYLIIGFSCILNGIMFILLNWELEND